MADTRAPHRRRVSIPVQTITMLVLACSSACNAKSQSQWEQEFFDRQVEQVKAGTSDWIQLYDLQSSDALWHGVVGLKGVKRVTLAGPSHITAAGIADIATLPDLTTIDFYKERVPNEWLKLLAASPTLQEVEVHGSMGWHIAEVLALPHLRKLRLDRSGHQTAEEILAALADASFLEEIEFADGFDERKSELIALQKELPNCKMTLLVRTGNQDVPIAVNSFEQPTNTPKSEQP